MQKRRPTLEEIANTSVSGKRKPTLSNVYSSAKTGKRKPTLAQINAQSVVKTVTAARKKQDGAPKRVKQQNVRRAQTFGATARADWRAQRSQAIDKRKTVEPAVKFGLRGLAPKSGDDYAVAAPAVVKTIDQAKAERDVNRKAIADAAERAERARLMGDRAGQQAAIDEVQALSAKQSFYDEALKRAQMLSPAARTNKTIYGIQQEMADAARRADDARLLGDRAAQNRFIERVKELTALREAEEERKKSYLQVEEAARYEAYKNERRENTAGSSAASADATPFVPMSEAEILAEAEDFQSRGRRFERQIIETNDALQGALSSGDIRRARRFETVLKGLKKEEARMRGEWDRQFRVWERSRAANAERALLNPDAKATIEKALTIADRDDESYGESLGRAIHWQLTDPERKPRALSKYGDELSALAFVSAPEAATLLYYAGLGDYDAVENYFHNIRRNLNAERQNYVNFRAYRLSKDAPPAAVAANLLAGLGTGAAFAAAVGRNVKNRFSGNYEPVDTNTAFFLPSHIVSSTAEGLLEDIENPASRLMSETALNIGRNLVRMPLGGPVTMGLSAAGQSVFNALNRGANPEDAIAYGVANGAVEALTEMIPIDSLFGMMKEPGKKTLENFLKSFFTGAGVNATQEWMADVAKRLADEAILGELSDMQRLVDRLVDEGMTPKAAKDAAGWETYVKEPLRAALQGALSDGIVKGFAKVRPNVRSAMLEQNPGRAMGERVSDLRAAQDAPIYAGEIPSENTRFLPTLPAADALAGSEMLPTAEEWTDTKILPTAEDISSWTPLLTGEELARMEQAATETERSGIRAGASDEAIQTAHRLSKRIRRPILFFNAPSNRDGYYLNGAIYINANSKSPIPQIVSRYVG